MTNEDGKKKQERRILRDSVFALTRRLSFLKDKLQELGGKSGRGGYLEAEIGGIVYALKLMESRKKEMNKENQVMKWVLIFELPKSGSLWALGPNPHDKTSGIALYPVKREEPTALKGVFGFETQEAAQKFLDDMAKLSEQGAKMAATTRPMLADQLQ